MLKYFLFSLLLVCQESYAQSTSSSDSLLMKDVRLEVYQFPYWQQSEQDSLLLNTTVLLRQPSQKLSPILSPISISEQLRFNAAVIAPALLIGAGMLTQNNPEYFEANEAVQEELTRKYAGFHTKLDDYTRYVPLAAVYGLNLVGVKGRNNFVNLSMIAALSGFINNTLTNKIKQVFKERRPDAMSLDAFPSQHTSIAFANAEIMHQEYKDQSAWGSVAGYSFAVATGSLRMLNNRHWLSDVVAGAGVGILSTHLAYTIYPWLQEQIKLKLVRKNLMGIAPIYQNGSYGLTAGFIIDPKPVH